MGTRTSRCAALALAVLLLPACRPDDGGGGDGGVVDYGPQLTIDAALVSAHLADVVAVVPTCTLVDAGAAGPPPPSDISYDGSCGGTADATYEHADGDTTYDLAFHGFCVTSAETEVVLDGAVTGVEDGTPGDAGPVIEGFELRTDGPLDTSWDGGHMTAELDRLRTDYGVPATWAPGTPDKDNPDHTSLGLLTLAFPEGEHADVYLAEVEVERVGSPAEMEVLDGILALEGEGHVRVSTAAGAPLLANPFAPEGGVLVFTGADGTEARASLSAGAPAVLVFEVNGAPLDQALDCSDTLGALLEVAAVLGTMPIYH